MGSDVGREDHRSGRAAAVATLLIVVLLIAWLVVLRTPHSQEVSGLASTASATPSASPIQLSDESLAYAREMAHEYAWFGTGEQSSTPGTQWPSSVTDAQVIAVPAEQALAILGTSSEGSTVVTSDQLVVVRLTGAFTVEAMPIPPGASTPKGRFFFVALDPKAQRVIGFLVSDSDVGFSLLGPTTPILK